MRIALVGGGLMGLATAFRLVRRGHTVNVFESGGQIGGLTTWYDFGPFVWDKFYHVILPTDSSLIAFIGEIGLADRLRWETTHTGFFVDERLYSLDNGLDFLRFPPLSMWSKFRLGMSILYCSRINDWRRLEKIPVEDWLIRVSGRATYEKIWKPLLLAKLGENYKRVSAVFIWSYIKRMFSARDGSAQKEQLGYVSGGYRTVFARLAEQVRAQGGEIATGVSVESIAPGSGSGIEVTAAGHTERFDKVVCTSPVNVLERIAAPGLLSLDRRGEVEYLGVICMAVVTKRTLSPYYVLNIADERVPFTGVIGMSSVVNPKETDGCHLTYLPKYVLSTDPLLECTDEEIRTSFLAGLKIVFPEFDERDIVAIHINRAIKVQPLQVLGYSELVPATRMLHPDFYVLNTAQFVNNTLNNNEVISAVNEFFDDFGSDFEASARPH